MPHRALDVSGKESVSLNGQQTLTGGNTHYVVGTLPISGHSNVTKDRGERR